MTSLLGRKRFDELLGGLTCKPEGNPTFDQKTIDAYKLTDLIKVSVELLDDSAFPLEPYIAKEFASAFGVAEETAFCVGTGSGQPTGLFTANGGAVGITAAGATAVTADEVISLIYALKAPYRKNAKFLMNDSTVAALRKLKDGNGQYLVFLSDLLLRKRSWICRFYRAFHSNCACCRFPENFR